MWPIILTKVATAAVSLVVKILSDD